MVQCSQCGVPHHEECWKENGGCTVYGCKGWALWPGLNLPQYEERTYEQVDISKTKTRGIVLPCPMCKAEVRKGMTQCDTCGYELPDWIIGKYVIDLPWWALGLIGLGVTGGIAYGVMYILGMV